MLKGGNSQTQNGDKIVHPGDDATHKHGQHTYFIKLSNLNAYIERKKEGIILLENR